MRRPCGRSVARDEAEAQEVRAVAGGVEQVDLRVELKEAADEEAIRVFGVNLEQLLLQPPAGVAHICHRDSGLREFLKGVVHACARGKHELERVLVDAL